MRKLDFNRQSRYRIPMLGSDVIIFKFDNNDRYRRQYPKFRIVLVSIYYRDKYPDIRSDSDTDDHADEARTFIGPYPRYACTQLYFLARGNEFTAAPGTATAAPAYFYNKDHFT
eukprot:SAG31_NODE_8016_length_1540_cov_1.597502_2_plen_114_part_00